MKSGQTCLEIAATVGTTINILLANNPNLDSDCTTLYSDEASISTDTYTVASLMLTLLHFSITGSVHRRLRDRRTMKRNAHICCDVTWT